MGNEIIEFRGGPRDGQAVVFRDPPAAWLGGWGTKYAGWGYRLLGRSYCWMISPLQDDWEREPQPCVVVDRDPGS
jgi:hypothetical protein